MRVLFVTPNPSDPLSFYRGSLPMSRLRQHHGIEFTNSDAVGWNHIVDHDVIFFQRPFNPQHIEVMRIAKDWGKPIIIDYDDWLHGLMQDNPAYFVYERSKPLVIEAETLANTMMVATEHMKDLYADKGITSQVVPNAYDTEAFTPADVNDRQKIVLWRGSNSHIQDLISVRLGWLELIKRHPDWQFVFMNVPPWWLGDTFDNVHVVEGQGIKKYMNVLQSTKPAIMTHPLMDTDFNRAKSMCSWIEACHAGAAFVGPDFKEYQRDGISNYKAGDSESFFNSINFLIENPEMIPINAKKGQEIITTSLSLREVNKLRAKLFHELNNKQ